ncbi:YaaC family protein [Actinomadura nitritigenes]|uniref:YaaC family protein n=1 Tax=Actinomadura nitritigenes TaxID=134602 RepID=UPI00369D4A45
MVMQVGRMFQRWQLSPIFDPTQNPRVWPELASIPLLREGIRRHAEIEKYSKNRFSGPLSRRNFLWKEYRNFLRQAISNYDAAIEVPNRSACLLYYYSLLNFAKAELLATHSSALVGKFISHGLSFSTYKAKTVAGDALNAKGDGVFKLLYEFRTGRTLPSKARLPIKRILANIPEIASQMDDAGLGTSKTVGLIQLIAIGDQGTWPVLLTDGKIPDKSSTGKLFYGTFKEMPILPDWRDRFALSRRMAGDIRMYESKSIVPHDANGNPDIWGALGVTWRLKDILSPSYSSTYDGVITPSLYDSKMLPMPASLARYALLYYASSLVRYRPSMFDSQLFPAQGLLFDAIARESAIPVLRDVLAALEGNAQLFYAEDAMRL